MKQGNVYLIIDKLNFKKIAGDFYANKVLRFFL